MKTTLRNKYAFEELIDLFRSEGGDRVKLPKHLGLGQACIVNLEKGLQVRLWDVRFNRETHLYNNTVKRTDETYFTLAFFLSTRGLLFSHGGAFLPENQVWDTLFISNCCDYKIYISPKARGHCLGISFSKQWLDNNVLVTSCLEPLQETIHSASTMFFRESMSSSTKEEVLRLLNLSFKTSIEKFHLKSSVLLLLADFFCRLKEKVSVINSSNRGSINDVERYLQNILTGPLPPLGELASRCAVSPSTLSRHFKRAYGMSISAYFIKQKMAYAEQMLKAGCRSLTDVAYYLGYKSVNNFRVMLRKYLQDSSQPDLHPPSIPSLR
jgi:AraC-like DNA-binding protein